MKNSCSSNTRHIVDQLPHPSTCSIVSRLFLALLSMAFLVSINAKTKTKTIPPSIVLRPVMVHNVAISSNGKLIAVPNLITAGSAGVFNVSEGGTIVKLPQRFTEKDFYRVAGVFYFASSKKDEPPLVFISLPELLSGYTVTFTPTGDALAISGGEKVFMYSTTDWLPIRTVTVSPNTTRTVFSSDGSKMAVLGDGVIYLFDTETYAVRATIQPLQNHKFADILFSGDSKKIAALEYKNLVMDHTLRVRLFSSDNGDIDRDLPWFPDKLSSPPGSHFPLISFTAQDSALLVSLEKPFSPKTFLIKSNDGTLIREFRGAHHAISPDRSLAAVGGTIYLTSDWKDIGRYNRGTLCCAFSPTDMTLVAITADKLERFKIELE